MSKITRRSYKRKKIIMGASLLGGVGLVSTGFAAWVLSASTESKQQPNMSVGAVSDKTMEFKNIKVYKTDDQNKDPDTTFHFEPKANDKSGRVRSDGENVESLSLTIEGELYHAQYLGDMTAILTVASDKQANFTSALGEPKKYIKAPEAYSETAITLWKKGEGVKSDKFTASFDEETEKTLSFTYVVEFTWGDFFKNQNPGEYFDNDVDGLKVQSGKMGDSYESGTVAGYLTDLHALLDTIQLELVLTANPD